MGAPLPAAYGACRERDWPIPLMTPRNGGELGEHRDLGNDVADSARYTPASPDDVRDAIHDMGRRARIASYVMARASTAIKDAALRNLADVIRKDAGSIR